MNKQLRFGDDIAGYFPDWFHYGKSTPASQKRRVLAGLHPMGNRLSDNPASRCGNCKHLIRKRYSKVYHKCNLYIDTNGPASDIRVKWLGCAQWDKGTGWILE